MVERKEDEGDDDGDKETEVVSLLSFGRRGGEVEENLDSEGKEPFTLEWKRSGLVPHWVSDRPTVENGSDQPTHLITSSRRDGWDS